MQLGQHAAGQFHRIALCQEGGHGPHRQGFGRERDHLQPQGGQGGAVRLGSGHLLRGGGKGGGNQQGLAGNGLVVAHLGFQALVNNALVRGVHIDDDHALGVFRQDVNAVDLRHGAAQRPVLGRGRCWRCAGFGRGSWQQGRWWRLGGFLALAMRAAGWLRAAVPTGPACVWGSARWPPQALPQR